MIMANKLSGAVSALAGSAKSMVKIALESRRCTISKVAGPDDTLIVMGNGPSLSDTMHDYPDVLDRFPLLSVNFAANAEEFYRFRSRYYVMADPIFFAADPHVNVAALWRNLAERVNWCMTLFVPVRFVKKARALVGGNRHLRIEGFNMVGVSGFHWLENLCYGKGLGMPRPRNVLIVALMVALKMGFGKIYVTGADHSWTKTLEVSDDNLVVTVQPHFYKDNDSEHSRVASVYKDIRLHEILHSFSVAFRSYFSVERYARHVGTEIYNATPGSFIDAFRRRSLGDLL